jgi:hypothetical protein
MKIIFYDINLLNHKKYIGDIIDNMILDNNIFIMYDEYNEEGYNYFKNKNCVLIHNKFITYRGIKKNLTNLNPDLLIVNAQRLSDSAYVAISKQLNIKTIMIQHGMYIPFMKRERFFFLKKISKTIKYFMYSQAIAKVVNENGLKVFKKFLQTFVKGKIYKDSINFYNSVNVDYVLVYGEYWKQYHYDIFGYDLEQQMVIGYHELNKIDDIKNKKFEKNSICYIAQTLVEDGRLDRSKMIKFIDILKKISKNRQIYIKLHPRSDRTLYDNEKFILLEDNIPNVGLYIGHYSSLIALVGYLKGNTILYEFKEHKIPHYFREFSKIVYTEKELLNLLNYNLFEKNETEKIEYYFSKSYKTSKVVEIIYNLLKENNNFKSPSSQSQPLQFSK